MKIGNILNNLRTNVFCNNMLETMDRLGLRKIKWFLINTLYLLLKNFQTDDIEKSREFFDRNKDKIDYNINILADEESKYIYRQMIEFRKTYDLSLHPGYNAREKYFPTNVVKITENEIFIDGEGYNGDTIIKIAEKTEGKYKAIISFEPDKENFAALVRNCRDMQNVYYFQKGLWSEDTKLMFDSRNDEASKIILNSSESKDDYIETVAIDNYEELGKATYIKLDIEGAEMEALHGAERTLKKHRPKLAICIYHSDEDMLNIIPYLQKLVPEYKLYVRQHDHSAIETVLYAIV